MLIENEQLADKTILEVGCGLGRTTRNLVSLLTGHPGAKLIVTDVSEQYLVRTRSVLGQLGSEPQFIRTHACELVGIQPESIDYIVCNFALCEINSDIGQGTLALAKFLSVLKPGGKLFVEEEFPISEAEGPAQQSWARIWQVLKSAFILIQQKTPSNEYRPDVLRNICESIGFIDVRWEAAVRSHGLDWMDARLGMLEQYMSRFPGPQVGQMFMYLAKSVSSQAREFGKIDVPVYTLLAIKP
jgi:ubiquinone/menaquinone biosynthesis C-methylase UbiE